MTDVQYAVVRAPKTIEDAAVLATNPMPWPMLLLIRVARTYVQAFVGVSTIQGLASGPVLSLRDVWQVVASAAVYAAAVAAVALVQNFGEYLAKIDVRYPAVRA